MGGHGEGTVERDEEAWERTGTSSRASRLCCCDGSQASSRTVRVHIASHVGVTAVAAIRLQQQTCTGKPGALIQLLDSLERIAGRSVCERRHRRVHPSRT